MTIQSLILLSIVGFIALLLWQHLCISRTARDTASRHCEKHGVVLLDQSVLLQKIHFRQSPHTALAIERCYSFEFSSVGDTRYLGKVIYVGKRLIGIQLEPYKSAPEL